MPTWGQILKEVNESARARAPQGPDLDGIRLKYIQGLQRISGRAVISYASGWLNKRDVRPSYSVEGADVHGLMEVCHGVRERELDLILHSPGGSAQAADQIIEYLRTRFDYIRAIVPLQAKSAATMIALGCDEILMGDHSELGPIDPQILVPVPEGIQGQVCRFLISPTPELTSSSQKARRGRASPDKDVELKMSPDRGTQPKVVWRKIRQIEDGRQDCRV